MKKNSLDGYCNCLYIRKLDPEINNDLGDRKEEIRIKQTRDKYSVCCNITLMYAVYCDLE